MKRSKSINDLTKDDSKILGIITGKKLEKSSQKNHFNTSQFKTIYSNWTPVANKLYNKTIFQERIDVIFNWFDVWTDQQRNEFLTHLFPRCSTSQFSCTYDYFDKLVPMRQVDLTKILPKVLSLKIFSYLDPRSLCRASQVSWHWKFLTEQDELWMPKCQSYGWYLPYSPSVHEFGAWKRHYISNAISVDMSVGQIRGSVWRRLALTDSCKSPNKEKINKETFTDVMNNIKKSANTKPQWAVSSSFPMDLEHGSRALFAGWNPNETQFHASQHDMSNIAKSSPRNANTTLPLTPRGNKNKKVTLTQILDMEKQKMAQTPQTESTIQGSDIVKAGDIEPLSWQKPTLNNMQQLWHMASGYSGWANPRVIFISSKLPAAEMLVDSVIFGVIPIPYDYDSSNLKTMIYDLRTALQGRKAKSIGLFGHRNKENDMWIVRNKYIGRKNNNISNVDVRDFINNLAANVLPKEQHGHIDLFSPFGAFDSGNELLVELHELTNITFTAPASAIGQYNFIVGNWNIHPEKDIHPCLAYFANNKLNFWIEFGAAVNEIVHDTKMYLKSQYAEIDELIMTQITGSIVREAAMHNQNLNIKEITQSLLKPLIKCDDEENPLLAVHQHLTKLLFGKSQNKTIESHSTKENEIMLTPSKKKKNKGLKQDENSMSPTKQKIQEEPAESQKENETSIEHYKQSPFKPQFSMRKSIIKELLLNEKRHLQILKSIQEFYYVPLKRALLSNRSILGVHNIQVIFGDILMFIEPSENLITKLESRLKQWSTDQCVGDLLENYTSDLLSVFGSFFISYTNSLLTIDRCRETNLKFRNFLLRHDNQPESGMLSLNELFLRPTYRILEYISIIQWILSSTPPEHADTDHLRRTLTGLSKINKIIVQEKSRILKDQKFKEIQNMIINCPLLVEPGRYFVTNENLMIYVPASNLKSVDPDFKYYHQAKDCGIFLFSDSLIITRITREYMPYCRNITYTHSFEQALSLGKLTLHDIPDRKDVQYAFQLRYGPRMWILGCHSVEKKYHLTSMLKQYIQLCGNEDF